MGTTVAPSGAVNRLAPVSMFDKITRRLKAVDTALDEALAELAWMDVPVLVLESFEMHFPRGYSGPAAGVVVHLNRVWALDGRYDHTSAYPFSDCLPKCSAVAGPRILTRGWRTEYLGTYRILGNRDRRYYLAAIEETAHVPVLGDLAKEVS